MRLQSAWSHSREGHRLPLSCLRKWAAADSRNRLRFWMKCQTSRISHILISGSRKKGVPASSRAAFSIFWTSWRNSIWRIFPDSHHSHNVCPRKLHRHQFFPKSLPALQPHQAKYRNHRCWESLWHLSCRHCNAFVHRIVDSSVRFAYPLQTTFISGLVPFDNPDCIIFWPAVYNNVFYICVRLPQDTFDCVT